MCGWPFKTFLPQKVASYKMCYIQLAYWSTTISVNCVCCIQADLVILNPNLWTMLPLHDPWALFPHSNCFDCNIVEVLAWRSDVPFSIHFGNWVSKKCRFLCIFLWILPLFRMYFYHIIVLTVNTLHRIANIVYSMRTENIESVMCNGCWLMQNHKILTVNEVRCCQFASLTTHSDSVPLDCANVLFTLSCFATHLIAKNGTLQKKIAVWKV